MSYDLKSKQTNKQRFLIQIYYIQAWEPSAAMVTKSYSSRLPPLKWSYQNLKNQAKNIPVGFPIPQ